MTVFSTPVFAGGGWSFGAAFVLEVPRAAGEASFDWSDLSIPASATNVSVTEPPLHGTLIEEVQTTYTLTPTADFWTLGADRFEISYDDGGSTFVVSGFAVAAGEGNLDFATGFEIGDQGATSTHDPNGVLTQGASGAILDLAGIDLELDGTPGDAYLAYSLIEMAIGDPPDGGSGCDGGTGIIIATPDPPGESPLLPGKGLKVLSASQFGESVAAIELGFENGSTVLRGVITNNDSSIEQTPWVPVSAGIHRLRMDWWTGTDDGGLVFSIDDEHAGEIRNAKNDQQFFNEYRLGALDAVQDLEIDYQLDRFLARNGPAVPDFELGCSDDFDTTLIGWEDVWQVGGSVAIDAIEEELEITMGSGWGAYVREDDLTQETSLVARFELDSTLLTMASGDQLILLIGSPGTPVTNNHLVLAMRPDGDDFELRGTIKDNAGSATYTAWNPVSRGSHVIEARWRAATGPGTGDGYLRLWLDGQEIAKITGIHNDQRTLETLRLGAMGIDAGTIGTITYDDFALWVGPDAAESP